MPRPAPPPTPGSSSDLRGKEGPSGGPAFASLPPTAYPDHPDRASTSSATPSANGSDSSYRPISPGAPPPSNESTASARRRTAAAAPPAGAVITREDFALPPPPTRSRKIIQMKPPREHDMDEADIDGPTAAAAAVPPPTGAKRKQNNANTTAAGRKIARKTAHSLIERRRRSKMNEEFGVLKDMIPACKGQEMHKLAILQASIEYLRYLEQCVADLQAQNHSPRAPPPSAPPTLDSHAVDDDEDEDEEMEDDDDPPRPAAARTGSSIVPTPAATPTEPSGSNGSNGMISLPSLSQITTTTTTSSSAIPGHPSPSPSLFALGAGAGRHYSISSAASQASYSPYFHSTQTSPAFGPQLHHVLTAPPAFGGAFGLGSPALKPVDSSGAAALRQIAEGASELAEQRSHLHSPHYHSQQQQQQQQHPS